MEKTLRRSLLLLFVAALAVTSASAASLIGRVTEVHEGDLMTVMSLNRPVRIRLMAIDAPDKDQPFAESARQHLSNLVLDKFVVVEYSGLVQSRYILGRMFVDDRDVGAQMLRDGVAWYDASAASRLTQAERELYEAIEKLARGERRGLWQDESPVSPWSFRESLLVKSVVPQAPAQSQRTEKPREPTVLTNQDFMRAVGSSGGNTLRAPELSGAEDSDWKTLSPQGYDFSVLVPAIALEKGASIPTPGGKDIDYNVAIGDYERATYLVIWGSGPRDVRPISSVMDDIATGLTDRMNEGLALQGMKLSLKVDRTRDLKVGVMDGAEYKLFAGRSSGVMRIFIKQMRAERVIYLIGVVNAQGQDSRIAEFLNSLNFGKGKVDAAAKNTSDREVAP